ncbi:MAG: IS1 family transposase [Candidatus Pacebacteria bacterium]|nr:IS1 family transposase [Candidatus Paceibacterota bacterium]
MIADTIIHTCRRCGSSNIVRNGHNACGNRQYRCNDCSHRAVLMPKIAYSEERRKEILDAYRERSSMRGIQRIFGVSRQTLARWLKGGKTLPPFKETVDPAQPDDVLELDELWSFVGKKSNKRWLWTAMCRRTRQIVAFVIGDRSEATCRRLWNKLPDDYRQCRSYSDFWDAYQAVFPSETHESVGKESGETAHMERWNNTLRQRLGRYVRKTLSFSKSDAYHEITTKLFIADYNSDHRQYTVT